MNIIPLTMLLSFIVAPPAAPRVMRYEADVLTVEMSDIGGEKRPVFEHVHRTMDLDMRTAKVVMTRVRYEDRTETYVHKPGKTLITIERPGGAAEVKTKVNDSDTEEEIANQAADALRSMAKKKKATTKVAGQPCALEVERHQEEGVQYETRSWVPTDAMLSHALGNLQLLQYRLDGKQPALVYGYRLMNVRVRPGAPVKGR